jgi:hypothetical protein
MSNEKRTTDLTAETVRAILAVFVLFGVSECIAPFFHVSFSDPLAMWTIVGSCLAMVVGNTFRKRRGLTVLVYDSSGGSNLCLVTALLDSLQIERIVVCTDKTELLKLLWEGQPDLIMIDGSPVEAQTAIKKLYACNVKTVPLIERVKGLIGHAKDVQPPSP